MEVVDVGHPVDGQQRRLDLLGVDPLGRPLQQDVRGLAQQRRACVAPLQLALMALTVGAALGLGVFFFRRSRKAQAEAESEAEA